MLLPKSAVAASQVQLPASVGNELMAQDASKNGSIFFELRSASGTSTHASVLDYTAPEGTVSLPPQTADSLFGQTARAHGTLQVTYTTLPKGKYHCLPGQYPPMSMSP